MNKKEVMKLSVPVKQQLTFPIELKAGNSTFEVDFLDWLWAKDHKWSAVKTGGKTYIARTFGRNNDHRGFQYLHREILGLTKGDNIKCDHKDRNPFNNCRDNLRRATQAENTRNMKRFNSTGWMGINRSKKCKTEKYTAYLTLNYKRIYLGTYDTPEETALARDIGAKFYHGAFASLNYPDKYVTELLEKITIKAERFDEQKRINI